MNPEASELPVSQCYVAGFHVDAGEDSGKGVYVNLSGKYCISEVCGGGSDSGIWRSQGPGMSRKSICSSRMNLV